MTRASGPRRALTVAFAAMLAIAACQTAPPATSSQAAATSVPSTVPSTEPSPTTAAAIDVVAAFKQKSADLDSGTYTFEATARVGLVQVTLSGNSAFNGPDGHSRVTTTVAGNRVDSESTQVAGKRYQKTGSGPWLEVPITSSNTDLSGQISSAAKGTLKDAGTEERNGQTVHKLVPDSSSFNPAALLGNTTGVEGMNAQIAFYATDDGTPTGATIDATWKQTANGQTVDGSLEFSLVFSRLGSQQTIRVPDDIWKVFTSGRYHYKIAHPAEWTFFKAKTADELDAPYYAYVLINRSKTLGGNLNQWANGEISALKKLVGDRSVTNESAALGGVQARLLSATGSSKSLGKKVVVHEAIAIKSGFVYFVIWVSEVGHEAEDLAIFRQMLGTFAYA